MIAKTRRIENGEQFKCNLAEVNLGKPAIGTEVTWEKRTVGQAGTVI